MFSSKNSNFIIFKDEGHAPSVELKSQIARALKSADRKIPFSTDDLNLDGDVVAPTPSRVDAPKAAQRAAKKPKEEPKKPKDEPKKPKEEPKKEKKEHVPLSEAELQDLIASLKVK